MGEKEIFYKTASKPQVQLQRECHESLIIKAKVKHGREGHCFFLLHVFVDAFKALLDHVETAQEVQAKIPLLMILSDDSFLLYLDVCVKCAREDKLVSRSTLRISEKMK